jgi:inosine-uridine nucleoside N-ribohydrolase
MTFIVDTDPGLDDALALRYLWSTHHIDLITTVAGNTYADDVTANAKHLRDAYNEDTPIRRGANQPLRAQQVTTAFHGDHGLGSTNTDHDAKAPPLHAEHIPADATILAIAPLTNIAQHLTTADTTNQTVFFLGGTRAQGNIHGEEFNAYADPHAAQTVFNADIDLTVLPLDVAHDHSLPTNQANNISFTHPTTQAVWEDLITAAENVGSATVCPYDLLLAYLVDNPDAYTATEQTITITTTPANRGHTEFNDGGDIAVITDIADNAVRQALTALPSHDA